MAIGSTVKRTRTELDRALAVLAKWEGKKATAEASLMALQVGLGERALEDEDGAAQLPRQMAERRDEIDVASQAIAAAWPRVEAARRAVLHAEAATFDPAVERARETLTGFRRRREELLAAVREHTGQDYVPWEPTRSFDGAALHFTMTDHEAPLIRALMEAERLPAIIRAVAEGQDATAAAQGLPVKQWPAVVAGPGAVLPAPQWQALVQHEEAEDAARAAHVAALDDELDRNAQRVAELRHWISLKPMAQQKRDHELAIEEITKADKKLRQQRENVLSYMPGRPA